MPQPTEIEHNVLENLCKDLGISHDSASVTALSGGLLRRTYRVVSEAGDWVVRRRVDGRDRHRLELRDERKLLETLSTAGLTVPIVQLDSDDLLVTQYLADAATWTAIDAHEPVNIARLSRRLRELHEIEHDLPSYSAVNVAEDYCRSAESSHALTPEQRDWVQEFLGLARAYDAASVPTVICHQDLVAENILDDGQLWIIDFEYAVCAEPILDLAGVAGMNNFNAEQRDCLLEAYYQGATPPFSLDRFTEVTRLLRLQSYFWALATHDRASLEQAISRFVEDMAAVLR
jgi:thiamine kinase-like enzyme